MKITKAGLVWQAPQFEGSENFLARLHVILRSWDGTPYMAGQQMKGAGVDCVRFVCGVLDEMLRQPSTGVESLPPDTAMNNRRGAVDLMRAIRRRYPNSAGVPAGQPVQPLDIIVVGHLTGGPGHAILVGDRPNTLWQAGTLGVYFTGLGLHADWQHVFRVYRFTNREMI